MSNAEREAVLRLRESFEQAGYFAHAVRERLGDTAFAALGRGERVPAERATRDGDPLDVLIRLFLLHVPVPASIAATAVPLEVAQEAGVVGVEGDDLRARWSLTPYDADGAPEQGWWIASDPSPVITRVAGCSLGPKVAADTVLGVGGASSTLAGLAVDVRGRRALDLGTGCGVQALHLARRSDRVVATDIAPRALRAARLTARLSGIDEDTLRLREGDLLQPVANDRFDLIVSNPPFVVRPRAGGGSFTYRDGGRAGDDLSRQLVQSLPDHLCEGGWAQLLANWQHVRGEDWRERVGGWLTEGSSATTVDSWVVQRDVLDIAAYVATWLHDAGEDELPDYEQRYDRWLGEFQEAGVEAVGFGFVSLHHSGSADPVAVVEEWSHPIESPLGPHVRAWHERQEWLRDTSDTELLTAMVRVADDVRQEQIGLPGAEDPEHLVLRGSRGMRRASATSTELAALVGACNGQLPLGKLLAAVGELLAPVDPSWSGELLSQVRQLVADGLLEPPKSGT